MMTTNRLGLTEWLTNLPMTTFIVVILGLGLLLWLVYRGLKSRRIKKWQMLKHPAAEYNVNTRETEKHMLFIAQGHEVKGKSGRIVIRNINQQTDKSLRLIRQNLSDVPANIIELIPAARWLFDNYSLMHRKLKLLQEIESSRNFGKLPSLAEGSGKGYPRAYIVAKEMVAAMDHHVREESIVSMLQGYQSVRNLTSAELWVLPDLLSLCLLEEIIVAAEEIIATIKMKAEADQLINRLIPRIWGSENGISDLLKTSIPQERLSSQPYISQILYRLKDISVDEADISSWLAEATGFGGANYTELLAEIVYQEGRIEARLEGMISALIASLKEVSDLNWEEDFEKVSILEEILHRDPAGIYGQMDRNTKNIYRWTVEKLAVKHHLAEEFVAGKAVLLAEKSQLTGAQRANHVGTFLIGKGRAQLAAELTGKLLFSERVRKFLTKIRGALYFVGIFMVTAVVLSLLAIAVFRTPRPDIVAAVLLLTASFFPAMEIGVEAMNQLFTRFIHPKSLPAMDFLEGIPDQCRTFVVMPVILGNASQVRSYVQRMEKYFLANRQDNLYFAILGDFKDAPTRVMEEDQTIQAVAESAIRALNLKYPGEQPKFSLFIRRRKWNPSENCWMGWERKRGKLEEFNMLLCGETETSYSVITTDPAVYGSFKYAITLDADTELVRDSAAKLVGIMEHPLNRPVFDSQADKVVDGYVIVQSEIRNRISSAKACLFSQYFSGQVGIDPYASVVSDVYQDTFNEGIFVGKGIYDIKAMHHLLHGAIPENSVLSHDLLESCLTRCAFASGIKLMDTCPSSIAAYTKREHRWIRGDWQLLPWLFRHSPVSGLSRWKLFENLRRSLMHAFYLLFILFNVFLFPDMPWLWLPIVFFNPAYQVVTILYGVAKQKINNPAGKIIFPSLLDEIASLLMQTLFGFVFMPYRAYVAIDAILRTLFRMLISRKRMLEWQTAEAVEKKIQNTLVSYIGMMWMSWLPGLAMLMAAFYSRQLYFQIGGVIIALLWFFSPVIAYFSSQPIKRLGNQLLRDEELTVLRHLARKTWRYFEDFSLAENHWICPDNYQLLPNPKTSDKSSPTNIGLQLISILTARDFGFLGLLSFLENCEKLMAAIDALPKWHGHLYNWYNIKTLQVLQPDYVSTVDSGNFIGYLIAMKNGLAELKEQQIFPDSCRLGLQDTMTLAEYQAESGFSPGQDVEEWLEDVRTLAVKLEGQRETWQNTEWMQKLKMLCDQFLADGAAFSGSGELLSGKKLGALAFEGHPAAVDLRARIDRLTSAIDGIVSAADFRMLYDRKHQLFKIGYHVSSQTPDNGLYDLLASEARLASFLAIAKGDVLQKHWFKLGRPLTLIHGLPTFVSWSGSMFEYLMPDLVMKSYPDTALSQSCLGAVRQQIAYGKKMKIPWGISEAQYFTFDADSNYQYKSFGVPRLRMQSSLQPAMVVAPYATMLALSILPRQAMENIQRLRQMGIEGLYGFYEALDFNRSDVSAMKKFNLVRCFMAHHQGMSLVAMNNFLHQNVMVKRFHREPMVQATEILLEETRSVGVVVLASREYAINIKNLSQIAEEVFESRYCQSTRPKHPCAHILANKHYMLMLTAGGQGFSSCDGIMLNRWRADTGISSCGSFIYVRDINSGKIWSNTYYPLRQEPDDYMAVFSHHKAEYKRRDGLVNTQTAITISPHDNIEVRQVSFTNNGSEPLTLEVTSYLEVVADKFLAELFHPVFNKLFLEIEHIADRNLLIAKRRQRDVDEKPHFVIHMIKAESGLVRNIEHEIDRKYFIGRGGSLDRPEVIENNLPLSGKTGFSIDPILSLRAMITVPAGKSASLSFITGYCPSREEAMRVSYEMGKPFAVEEIFNLAQSSGELEMKYLNIDSKQMNAIQDIVGGLYYPFMPFRGPAEIIKRNQQDQSGLWRFGISGDNPVMVVRVSQSKDIGLVKDVLTGYEYLRINHVPIDLVILNEQEIGYSQELHLLIVELTCKLKSFDESQRQSSLFILQLHQLTAGEVDLLLTVARMVFTPQTGFYNWHFRDRQLQPMAKAVGPQLMIGYHAEKPAKEAVAAESQPALAATCAAPGLENPSFYYGIEFFNGIGGFTQNGKEYKITLSNGLKTPMPWINVIANPKFGFHISESGAGYTWADNSRENKLTTWSNDPVIDPVSEVIYIKDEDSGAVTSPACLSAGYQGTYQIRHGFGYSVFEHQELELEQQMTILAAVDDPAKLWLLSLKNKTQQERHLTVTLYAEWVLGVSREQTSPYIVSAFDKDNGLLTARNVYSGLYREHLAFVFAGEEISSYTADRQEFMGAAESVRDPLGLGARNLSGAVGAGLEPCAAIQIRLTLKPGETREAVFGLGQTGDLAAAAAIVRKFGNSGLVRQELEKVRRHWEDLLSQVTIRTPDRAMDILMNGWLLYQVISCRINARAAFYQCGGAFGFRDQLQDVLALLDADPQRVRQHILLCCSRQFREGDVQHWWHPPLGQGVRTRISDDLLWLPYVLAEYIQHTSDYGILDEAAPYLVAEPLKSQEHEVLSIPRVSEEVGSVYEHCLRAIERAATAGDHGLPLIGGGDWNDGMNHVGIEGKGESVWLAWFSYAVLNKFSDICHYKGDMLLAARFREKAADLLVNIENHAWDGEWYIRAFYDNGKPLGSKESDECRIDSISQSWAVLSGGASSERGGAALKAADRYLVKDEDGVILLLTPPFNKTSGDPGYIKGYYPGIRENGGQYTHAAIWLAMAHAKSKDSSNAYRLLSMINPIHTTTTYKGAVKYENEPYVITADISLGEPYTGKGGWSWYTGSAGWMYQAILHSLLGISKKDGRLHLDPAVPSQFKEYFVDYKHGSALYSIKVINGMAEGSYVSSLLLDGKHLEGSSFELIDDGAVHHALVCLSSQPVQSNEPIKS